MAGKHRKTAQKGPKTAKKGIFGLVFSLLSIFGSILSLYFGFNSVFGFDITTFWMIGAEFGALFLIISVLMLINGDTE